MNPEVAESAGVKTCSRDLRPRDDRLLSPERSPRRPTAATAAGSNFDHGGNEERIPGDVGPRETSIRRVRRWGSKEVEKGREGER